MNTTLMTTSILWTAAISSGLMAGMFFAFSSFVMRAFSDIKPVHAIIAMQSINKTILGSAFMPLFFGSTIASVMLIFLSVIQWNEPGSILALTAGIIYLIGMFFCTGLLNVPLNESLAKVEPDTESGHRVWQHYRTTWTNRNHIRTVSSLATCLLCIWLIAGL